MSDEQISPALKIWRQISEKITEIQKSTTVRPSQKEELRLLVEQYNEAKKKEEE